MKTFYIFMKKLEEQDSLFMNYDWHEKNNVPVKEAQYNYIYGGFYNGEDTDMEILDSVYYRFNVAHPSDYRNRSVSVSDVIVIAGEDGAHAYFVDSFGFTEVPEFLACGSGELAVKIENRYISIAECDEGFDYSLYDNKFRLLDGGVYDDVTVSAYTVLHELLKSEFFDAPFSERACVIRGNVYGDSSILRVDYDLFMYNVDENPVDMHELFKEYKLESFRGQRTEVFHYINGMDAEILEEQALAIAEEVLEGADAKITGILLVGSRAHGTERPDSDIDFLLEYEGELKEDAVFNILAGEGMEIDGLTVDYNPIRAEESGTIASYVTNNF